MVELILVWDETLQRLVPKTTEAVNLWYVSTSGTNRCKVQSSEFAYRETLNGGTLICADAQITCQQPSEVAGPHGGQPVSSKGSRTDGGSVFGMG